MEESISIEIDAPADRVWGVLVDVERWPEWSETVTSARRLDEGPLRVGARTELVQPKIPKGVWTVTELQPGRSFTWEQAAPGARTTASHHLELLPDHRTRVHLAVEQSGWLGALVGRLYAGLTRRYLALESAGLKQRSESADA